MSSTNFDDNDYWPFYFDPGLRTRTWLENSSGDVGVRWPFCVHNSYIGVNTEARAKPFKMLIIWKVRERAEFVCYF